MARHLAFAVVLIRVFAGIMASDCPPVPQAEMAYYRSKTGTCYYKWPGEASYDDAKAACVAHGLLLVRLEELEEQEWLAAQTSNLHHWLGLSEVTGVWKWVPSGPTVSRSDPRWEGSTKGSRGYTFTSNKWAKAWPRELLAFICELDTTTITTAATATTKAFTTTKEASTAPSSASPSKNGTACSGSREFYLHRFAEDYHETLRMTSPVKKILECGVECINDGSCRGIRVVLHQDLCELLSPSAVYNMCPTDSVCYRFDDSNCL